MYSDEGYSYLKNDNGLNTMFCIQDKYNILYDYINERINVPLS